MEWSLDTYSHACLLPIHYTLIRLPPPFCLHSLYVSGPVISSGYIATSKSTMRDGPSLEHTQSNHKPCLPQGKRQLSKPSYPIHERVPRSFILLRLSSDRILFVRSGNLPVFVGTSLVYSVYPALIQEDEEHNIIARQGKLARPFLTDTDERTGSRLVDVRTAS